MIRIAPWYLRWHRDRVPYWYPEGLGSKVFQHCPNTQCEISNNLTAAHAVLISHKFLWQSDEPHVKAFKLPPYRDPSQKWIFVSNEPPIKCPVAEQYLQLFNGTFTYRADSDAHYPYGYVIRRPHSRPRGLPKPASRKWEEKGDVVWVASNCHAASKRELYVQELAKHINVTVYGDCGAESLDCVRSEANYYRLSCYETIEQRFKFYLAFENSLCYDYATEKFWRTLQQDMIPVVYGIYDYKANAPKNSYIDVRDFVSPKELAAHLKKLSADRELYDSYMAWKDKLQVVTNPFYRATCQLCSYLHQTQHHPPRTVDLREFWGEASNCLMPDAFLRTLGVHA
jgi:alpha-1,3-fucosyltransferase